MATEADPLTTPEQTQVTELLREHDQQFRLLIEHAPASIAVFDTQMRYLFHSRRWLEDFKLGLHDLRGQSHYDVFPEIPERWKLVHQRCIKGCVEYSSEDRFERTDGTIYWLRWEVRPWQLPSGNVGGIVFFSEDITNRKRDELELIESKRFLRSVLDSLTEHIAILDHQGLIVATNLAWSRFGTENKFPVAGFGIGMNYLKICEHAKGQDAASAHAAAKGIRDVLSQRIPFFELEYPCHDQQQPRWFMMRATRFENSGSPCVVVSHVNITEQHLAKLELHTSEERLRATLITATDAIISIDYSGLIEDINPATERMFGYARSELLGQNINVLMPLPYSAEHDQYLSNYLRTGVARIIGIGREALGKRKNGAVFPIDLTVSEIPHLRLFTGIVRDISDRKDLEKLVLEVSAEEQVRIGQELHDGTGQELTGLSMFASSLVDHLNGLTMSEGGEKGSVVLDRSQLDRLKYIAEKLLDGLVTATQNVRRLSHGIMPVQIDSEGLISALENLAATTSELRNTECILDYSGSVSIADSTIALNLYRIAQEAVTNALRHGRASQIRISLNQTQNKISIEIRDNGIGFNPLDLPIKSRERKTVGLGLKILNYRAGLIGGILQITRNEDCGMSVKCVVRNSV